MKKARLLLIPLAALSALLSAACGATVATVPPVVQTAVVARGRLSNSATVSGKLVPVQYADLFTEVPGQVSAVNVDVGSRVTAGQVLLTLDAAARAAALQQDGAAVAQARAGENAAGS